MRGLINPAWPSWVPLGRRRGRGSGEAFAVPPQEMLFWVSASKMGEGNAIISHVEIV